MAVADPTRRLRRCGTAFAAARSVNEMYKWTIELEPALAPPEPVLFYAQAHLWRVPHRPADRRKARRVRVGYWNPRPSPGAPISSHRSTFRWARTPAALHRTAPCAHAQRAVSAFDQLIAPRSDRVDVGARRRRAEKSHR